MATRNIVPRANEEGEIGRIDKWWLKGWFKNLLVGQNITDGTNTVTLAQLLAASSNLESYSVEDLTESNTTSSTLLQKIRLNLPSITAGEYFVAWSCIVSASVKNVLMAVRTEVDDTYERSFSCTELAGNSKYSDGVRIPYAGHFVETFSAGSHTIDMDWASGTAGKTVYIMSARLFAMRVGD